MAFKRTIEDFVCEHCREAVKGDGYTNHCPRCLWSKHVDTDPGDRANPCKGIMEPIALEGTTPQYRIVHSCKKCGAITRTNVSEGDDTEALLTLAGA
jgi:hypothetical protein